MCGVSGLKTKNSDSKREISISNEKFGFQTKNSDSKRKIRISNEKFGFQTENEKMKKSEFCWRISHKNLQKCYSPLKNTEYTVGVGS